MKILLLSFFLFFSSILRAQHYYNDLIGARELGDRMKDYAANNVKSVTATGYDERGMKSTDFNEWQEADAAGHTLNITTRTGQQVIRQTYQFDNGFRLTNLAESSGSIKSTTVYTYAGNNMINVKTTTADSLSDFSETNEHQWTYNARGKAERMLQIINGHDSSEYRLTTDEKGNIADEKLYRRGTAADSVLYYYNDSNKLTDIVRYDKKARKLLADVMLEYDDENRIVKKITTLSTTLPDYLIWRYQYNEKGLKTKEAMFGKMKQLKGRIEYSYSFTP